MSSYFLGVDVGTTYTAAAVWRDGRAEVCGLGGRAAVVPSVVFLRDDSELLIGEAAERRAASEPSRVAREFKRRVGDPTPVLVGGCPFSADALMAKVLWWTVDQVAQREGSPPAGLVISHPANWGPFKQDLLRQAIGLVDLGDAGFVTEPEAAAIHYATQDRTAPGTVVAVYDLGGGTFDAAVMRRTETGWEIAGPPRGIERLGGIDFDEAVFERVRSGDIGAAIDELDPDDPVTWSAIARLRQECVAAKEALASDTAASVPVLLPNLQRDVRLTRSELEELLRPSLLETVGALKQALRAADVETDVVDAVLLVGGSSRIPLVAEIIGAELRRPVAIDVHPKDAVALGAAIVAASASGPTVVCRVAAPANEHAPANVAAPAEEPADGEGTDVPTRALLEAESQDNQDNDKVALAEKAIVDVAAVASSPRGDRRAVSRKALVAAIGAIVLTGAGAIVALADWPDTGDDPAGPTTTTEQTTTTTPPSIRVPDLVGLTEQQARDRLAHTDLRIVVTDQPTTHADENGIVLAQNPPAATNVQHNATVKLTIGDLRPTPSPTTTQRNPSPPPTNPGGGGNPTTVPQTTTPTTDPPTTSTPTTLPPPTTSPTITIPGPG